jgi:transposase-like protein
LDLKRRGLTIDPKLAVGDGALGFWKVLPQVFGETRVQRCWVHKTANVLNKLPKHLQPKAKSDLHQIWMGHTRENARLAFDLFVQTYQPKYPKAAECLNKDKEALLTFMIFQPSTGYICEPRIQSNRRLRRFGCERRRRAVASPVPAYCRWYSS